MSDETTHAHIPSGRECKASALGFATFQLKMKSFAAGGRIAGQWSQTSAPSLGLHSNPAMGGC